MAKKYIVTTAKPLDEAKQEEIRRKFARTTGEDVAVTFLVNDELLGGMTIFDGERLYDGSIAYRLEKLKGKAATWKKN